ncbi:GNAT family N-acetyltransferase [Boudabousia liubingyangii]|uniref:GNAT family N-acetyltransferase n=1 Tax=Boudabousia liubingyangii TaxID=1921764 RepID=A0A1Q5PLL5_9ACTO|nr:GNAT family N-acetyltransferase [Boudabousia liubingyangii]OKL46939.1 GNAT family N-acetyltransferase [Boudabousia liubingyangii]OKL47951.1 GNAT family N-acetyltransferase [Boudabousia liubingyangii]
MTIELIDQCSEEVFEAVNHLIGQLSTSAKPLEYEATEALIDQPNVHLFVYRAETEEEAAPEVDTTLPAPIQGMLSLVVFEIPTGTRAWIEDVVVEESARGTGAGRALVEAAVAYAQELGAKSVDLTSRPSREAANRLYQRCGFQARETNVYRYQG